MATIQPTFTKIYGPAGGIEATLIQWALGNADTGAGVQLPGPADKSIQLDGTFGGATAVLEGSNDSTDGLATGTFITVNDPLGNAISTTSQVLKQVTEVTAWVRPRTSGGSGSAIVASLLMRRTVR